MIVTANELNELACRILTAAGAAAEDAKLVADGLVGSNLVGHDSHGVIRLPGCIRAIKAGRLNVHAAPSIVRESPDNAVIDADWGFGQVAATMAMDLAIAKAKTQSVACTSVFNCNDVGRLGTYSARAAEQDCIGIMTVNDGGANPNVVPWGGRTPLFSTNPISAAVPMSPEPDVCVDMATSVVAGGKVIVARKRGDKLPPGCIIDADGRASVDPNDFFGPPAGALLPVGAPVAGHKGSALSLIIDILSGALSGAGCSGSSDRDAQGLFMLVINIAAFAPVDEFAARTRQLRDAVKSSPRAEGVAEILLPGEPEWREKEKRQQQGIFVEDATWRELTATANELGVEVTLK